MSVYQLLDAQVDILAREGAPEASESAVLGKQFLVFLRGLSDQGITAVWEELLCTIWHLACILTERVLPYNLPS